MQIGQGIVIRLQAKSHLATWKSEPQHSFLPRGNFFCIPLCGGNGKLNLYLLIGHFHIPLIPFNLDYPSLYFYSGCMHHLEKLLSEPVLDIRGRGGSLGWRLPI